MDCNIKILTHLTDKTVKIVDMNGAIINDSVSNACISVPYDSYIVYMSNPIKITSFTSLLIVLENVFMQYILAAFLIVIAIAFFIFVQTIKNRGFKGFIK